jgi:hypothetical protein
MYPVGYKWLMSEMELKAIPHFCESYISEKNRHLTVQKAGLTEEHYPKSKTVENSICGHLEFAVKNEGVNPGLLKACFQKLNQEELTEHIRKKPTGKFGRILWFLYEELIGEKLDLPDLKQGNYVDLLDPEKYYTASPIQISRQRVNMNLLGDLTYSPQIRRTETLQAYVKKDFSKQCEDVLGKYPPELIRNALASLYTAETKSSFQIEQESLPGNKAERFIQLLRESDTHDYLNKSALVDLQQKMVANPLARTGEYRTTQEYVGSSSIMGETVHLVPPKPEDLDELMEALFSCAHRMMDSEVPPALTAAAIAFGFVYIHPFKDGNGRIHRFLIHHILSKGGFTPKNFIFPVSAVMYRSADRYQDTLNLFSRPLLQLIEYSLNHYGEMTVTEQTIDYYRYFDATGIAESLFSFIEDTIEIDFIRELDFLKRFAVAQRDIENYVDGLSGKEVRLFIRLKDQYPLSIKKREKYFSMLTDVQIKQMEEIVQDAFEE